MKAVFSCAGLGCLATFTGELAEGSLSRDGDSVVQPISFSVPSDWVVEVKSDGDEATIRIFCSKCKKKEPSA